ncbi:transferase [Polynucleobacter sp. Latsch14-2]|uniref:acyltransferase n=1 Tax=Polynucleobacter sp. Latsch14-2 TaxID=2576920 RepID=UPI001C0CA9F7|nr:transferase [Polynucleobacter sp. Latsch14-2]MBU3615524.1 transferase [Polynucleobacter sp. Latsch14-2]
MIRHICNIILWFLPPTRMFRLRNLMLRATGIQLGSDVRFCGRSWIYGRGLLKVGSDTWISPGAVIFTHVEAQISVGNCCDIGPGVEFITGGHMIGPHGRRAGVGNAKSIFVGNGVWIGAKSIILGGVTIGSGSIIAAGSLVRSDVPENSLVAGVPGVIKRTLDL